MEKLTDGAVAPLVGAWIEIACVIYPIDFEMVAPLVGAWIEIFEWGGIKERVVPSLPSWERGLK